MPNLPYCTAAFCCQFCIHYLRQTCIDAVATKRSHSPLLHCWAFFCNSVHHHYIVSRFCRSWQLAQVKSSLLWWRCDISVYESQLKSDLNTLDPHGLKPDLCAFGWSHDPNPLPFHLSLRKWQNETNHGPVFSRLWPKIFFMFVDCIAVFPERHTSG